MKKSKIIILLYILIGLLCGSNLNAQFVQNNTRSLFSDVKAFKEGDALTVLIVEDTKAVNSASTMESRSTDLSAGFDLSTGSASEATKLDIGIGSGNDFRGKGKNSRSERIRSKLSAKVESVEDNGNLNIKGERTTKINGETQKITISGIVRVVDIQPDNSVLSYNIMDLTLTIEGEGNITEVQEPGLLTKFFRLLF